MVGVGGCASGVSRTQVSSAAGVDAIALLRELFAARMSDVLHPPNGANRAPCPPPIFARKDLRRGRSDGSVPRNRCAIHDLHLYYYENPRCEEPLGVVNLRGLVRRCFLRSDVRSCLIELSDSNRCLHVLRSDSQ
jgi:hypothetical protein